MQFSWKRIFKISGTIILAGIIIAGIYFGVTSRPFKILFASVVLDNHDDFLPCEKLPFYEQVKKTLDKHQDVVQKIKDAGAFDVGAQEVQCPALDGAYSFLKGDIVIQYDTHNQRVAIEKIIGDNFFGIPYRGENH